MEIKRLLTNKKVIFILIMLISIIVIALATTPKQEQSPTKTDLSIKRTTEILPDEKEFYYLNQLIDLTDVTGYSWNKNELVYSTNSGIYSALTKKAILEVPIENISWSAQGKAIYKSGGIWSYINTATKEIKQLNINPSSLQVYNQGKNFIYSDNEEIKIGSVESGSSTVEINGNTLQVFVSQNDFTTINYADNEKNKLLILDSNFKPVRTLEIDLPEALSSTSPNAQTFALVNGSTLRTTNGDNQNDSFSFSEGSALFTTWISNNSLLVIEKTLPNKVGVHFDNLWLLDQGKKKLLTNSASVPARLDVGMQLFPNFESTVLPLRANNGDLWLLSLVPNVLPSYSEAGVTFFPIPNKTHD